MNTPFRFLYYLVFTTYHSISTAITVFRHGMRSWNSVLFSQEDYDAQDAPEVSLDTDEIIGRMDADELCNALNNAMYLQPDDPDTLYPEWFVELAREGVYLAGVMALNDHLRGECVVKFNDKVIAFSHDEGGWVPAETRA